MSKVKEIKQSKNAGLLVGVLSEKNLTIEDSIYETADKKKKSCKLIKGDLTIETENGVFKLRVWSKDKKADGTDNKTYKGFETICNTYVSKVDASKDEEKVADTISCSVKLNVNDYVGKDEKLKSGTQISILSASRVASDSELNTDFDVEGVIRSIKPETNKNEENTGRLVVELVSVGYGSVANPLTLIVPEDLKDNFEDMYEVGQTCEIYGEIVMKHIGGDNNKKQVAFGRKAQVNSGFDVMELVVIGGEEPYEDETDDEGNSKAVPLDTMKQLMNERQIYLETLEKEGYKGDSAKSSKKESKGLGEKKPLVDDSVPF